MTRETLAQFYAGTDYWPAKRIPSRPREAHLALVIRKALDLEGEQPQGGRLAFSLEGEELESLRPILLHEALFHFYKGFYNYLAARDLMEVGLLHWLNITIYYAKFYIARSVTTLLGAQSYWIVKRHPYFHRDLALLLGRKVRAYRMRLDVDLSARGGTLVFDRQRVNSHRNVWEDYRAVPESMDLTFFVLPESMLDDDSPWGIPRHHLARDRNEESYSFDGYFQLDFNLAMPQFKQYFERDYLKHQAPLLYDWETGEVLSALSTLWHLFRALCEFSKF